VKWIGVIGLLMMVGGFALTFHALSRARRLSAADRRIVVEHMRELMKPFGRVGWRVSTADFGSPEGVFMEFFYGGCGIAAGFGAVFLLAPI
jgi:hypothetical protein